VISEKLEPAAVPALGHAFGGSDNVGEELGGQNPSEVMSREPTMRRVRGASAADERGDVGGSVIPLRGYGLDAGLRGSGATGRFRRLR
jgi:hypothetical protein